MLKLIRNCFGDYKKIRYITDENGHIISIEFIEALVKFQKDQGLHAGTKVRRRHMRWY